MNISLTTPTLDELSPILTLIQELYDFELLSINANDTLPALKAVLDQPQLGHVFQIEMTENKHTELVGYIILTYSFSVEHGGRIALIDQFYIKPDWRSKGIGSIVIPKIEEVITEAGAHALMLETNIGNSGARTFYENHDFIPRRQSCMMSKKIDVPFSKPL
ncbi:GNAT family N-acetyltransferase [Vibrio sp. Of7-15]|uniref:GNAT family N-acetyltransferase n=1 Tax=Vibrio sp. Of7-15 TaxID=2724879 RepID=UPI001EF3333E|nr:GNAT family N-acetyltransferase [Vibrio sp. Of7-15]MCG7497024.1 GNAT family N-acetyltransferase [Vibrio sp. Of7-15]